jgi:hypothetical protein
MHLDVDVDGAAGVPAGIDRLEGRDTLRVRPLDPAQEVRARIAGDRAGVDAERVAVPDVDGGTSDRLAGGGVDDGEPEQGRRAGLALGDVAAEALAGDVEGAFGQLGGEDAGDGPGGDGERPRAGGVAVRGSPAGPPAAATASPARRWSDRRRVSFSWRVMASTVEAGAVIPM